MGFRCRLADPHSRRVLPVVLASASAAPAAASPVALPASAIAESIASTAEASAVALGASRTTVLLGPSFIDTESTSLEFRVVQILDRFVGGALVHLHESETARVAGLPIDDQIDRVDLSIGLEQCADIVIVSAVGQIPDVDSLEHLLLRPLVRGQPSELRVSIARCPAARIPMNAPGRLPSCGGPRLVLSAVQGIT